MLSKAYNSFRTLTVHKKRLKAKFNPLNLQPEIIVLWTHLFDGNVALGKCISCQRGLKKYFKKYLYGKEGGDTPGLNWKALWAEEKEIRWGLWANFRRLCVAALHPRTAFLVLSHPESVLAWGTALMSACVCARVHIGLSVSGDLRSCFFFLAA